VTAAMATARGSRLARLARALGYGLPLCGAMLVLSGCADRAGNWCDMQCQCEGCTDHDYEKCKIDVNEQLDEADAYGCSDQADSTYNCVIDRGHCVNRHLVTDDVCAAEYQDALLCVAANSDII
jgi:hypothetical protein